MGSEDEDDRDCEMDTILPTEDIDVAHDVDTLRIERLDESSIYLAGYTDGEDEPVYMYWLVCTEDGLQIDSEIHPDGI